MQVVSIVFPIFAIVLVGFLYGRRHAPDMAAANRLNLEVFTPALIFSVLAGKDFAFGDYWTLAVGGTLVVLGSGLIAWPIGRWLGFRDRTFVPPMMFTNSGNMGLPLALFAFGESALAAAVVLFLVENLLHFSVGNALLEGRAHPGVLLRMPMLQAALAGLVVSLAGVTLPLPLTRAVDLLGQVSIPLMLFALGVRMNGVDLRDWRIGVAGALVCPASGVLVVMGASPLLGLEGLQQHQLLMFGALPPAVLNYMLAEQFNQEPRQVAAIVLMGNLASLLVIPVVLAVVL